MDAKGDELNYVPVDLNGDGGSGTCKGNRPMRKY